MTEQSENDNDARADQTANGTAGQESAAPGVPHGGELRPAEMGGKALVMKPWQGLACALLAGLIVCGTLQAILPVYEMPADLQALQGPAIAPRLQEMQEHTRVARIKNATLSFGVLAFTLGLVLTAAELLIRRDPLRAVWGGLLAGVLAGVIGLGAGAAGAALSGALGPTDNPLVKPIVTPLVKLMLVQGAVLGVIGLGVGLAMSLPMFRPRLSITCMTGCLLGGLLAALIFPPAIGFVFPNANTEDLMPEAGKGRFLWVGLAVGLIGVTVTGLGKEKK